MDPTISEIKIRAFRPPIRWAGGKYRLSSVLIANLPKTFNRLIEPMVGSGALFFSSNPSRALLADTNEDLINYYHMLATNSNTMISKLLKLKASKNTYYKFRESKPRDNLNKAIRFAYLNRLCWNGVYRVNKDGQFNVPIGDRLPEKLWDEAHLKQCAEKLKKVTFLIGDFENIAEHCNSGDLVYFDPPYPKGAKNGIGFNRYTSERFGLNDHRRLAKLVTSLNNKGVYILMTLSEIDELIELYPKSFNIIETTSKSLISCNGDSRIKIKEVIFKNYT